MLRDQKTYTRFFSTRRTARLVGIPLVLVGTAVATSCSHDWDSYDPRVGDGSSSATSSSSSSGMDGSGGMGGSGGMSAGGMGGAGGGITCAPNTGKACYSGPPGTENMGACKGGATLCQADGMSYGPCLGEVLPIVEECNTTSVDDDCNGMVNDHCGIWAIRVGGSQSQSILGIATDGAGNVVLTGGMQGAADFGGGNNLTSAGGYDIFVAKFDKDGQHVWSKSFGGATDDEGFAVAVDAAGNSFITGYFTGTMTIGTTNVTAVDARDAYVIKLDPMGQVLGSAVLSGLTEQRGNAIAVDGGGNVIVTGAFATELDTSLGKLMAADLLDGFVVKYNGDLVPQWQKAFGGSGNDEGTSVATDAANRVYLTGYFDETVAFGGGTITDGGSADVFLAKFDSAGNHLLSKGFPATGDQYGDSIGVDAAGNMYLAGDFDTTIDMGAGPINSQGNSDVYVTKLDPNGMHVFTKTYGDSVNQYGRAMSVDKAGDIVFIVGHEGTVDYGSGPIANAGAAGSSDVVLVKLNGTTGAHMWSRRFGNASDQDVRCVTTDGMNNIFVGGEFYGSINVGAGTISASSGEDAFLVKFPP